MLRRGASKQEVVRLLGAPPLYEARVLHLSDAEGAFGGWERDDDPLEAQMFSTMEKYFLLGGDWCCTSRHANDGRVYPLDPPPLRMPGGTRGKFGFFR